MAQEEFNPLDPYSELPALTAPEADLGAYMPAPTTTKRNAALENQNLSYAYDYLLKQGFKPHQAAGIVGNLAQESGGRTDVKGDTNLPGGSLGLGQWNRERLHGGGGYTGLLPFSKERGLDPQNLYTQLDYMMHELKGPERKALEGVLASRNVDEAARIFGEAYERPNAKYANYENRVAQAKQFLGSSPTEAAPEAQGPQGHTYDIPLSNGQTLTVPIGIDRQKAINDLRASGLNVEGVVEHPLTNGKTLTLPESVNVADALADLQKQHPDQEWMTEEHATKTGFMPGVKAGFQGLGAQFERGAGELLRNQELAAKGKAWQEELAKQYEAPLETDPLSKRVAHYAGSALGGLAPMAGMAVAAPLLPEAAAMGALGAATLPIATGSLAGRYDAEGKPFDPYTARNIAAEFGETGLQMMGLKGLSPVAGQLGKSALKGAAGAVAADVPSVALERAAADQKLLDEKALEEYGSTALADILTGSTLGAAGAHIMRPKGVKGEVPSELPPEQAALSESLAPKEGPAESVEDLEAQARVEEELFKKAQEAAPKAEIPEEEIPEPTVRGREQAIPPVGEMPPEEVIPEAPPVEAPPVEAAPEPHFAQSILGLKPNGALSKRLAQYDISNLEHHGVIEEEINKSPTNIPAEKLNALEARMKEITDASPIQKPIPRDDFSRKGPQGGEEVRYPTEGGEGVRVSDQEGQRIAGEGEGKEEVTEPFVTKYPEIQEAATKGLEEKIKSLHPADMENILREVNPELAKKIPKDTALYPGDEARVKAINKKKVSGEPKETPRRLKDSEAYRNGMRALLRKENPEAVEAAIVKLETKTQEEVTPDQDAYLYAKETHPTTDSTGQRIHPTDEGIKNFWKNFAGTKIVDEEGRPIRVLHGTHRDVGKFAPEHIGSETDQGFYGPGYYFTSDPRAASVYATKRDYIKDEIRPGGNVIPTYLDIKKPYHTTAEVLSDAEIKRIRDSGEYDGIIATPDIAPGYTEYVAFHPEQIKSAIGNVGEFDTTKPEIIAAKGTAPENAHTVETLNDHLTKTYGKDAPQVEVSTAAAENVEPDVKGFYDPANRRVVLIADNIGKGENIHGLLRHEVAVHAKRLGKTDPEFKSILDRLQSLKEQGDATVAEAYNRVPKDTSPERVHEEALAYLSQHAPNLPVVKSFASWMRRMAHKLTGSPNWLKADDFGPMADAILKKEGGIERPAERLYAKASDVAGAAATTHHEGNWFERLYTPVRRQFVTHTAGLDMVLGKMPLYSEKGQKIRTKSLVEQSKRSGQIIGDAMDHGYLAVNDQGLAQAVYDPTLSPMRLLDRAKELPKDMQAKFDSAMTTLAQVGHNLRGAEMKAVMDDAQQKIKLGENYLNRIANRYASTKEALNTLEKLARKSDTPTVKAELEKARTKFAEAEKAYTDEAYEAGKKHVAAQRKLLKAVKDQFNKAKRDESGRLYDISEEQEKAARDFLNSTPEVKQLAEDTRELFRKNAKFMLDTRSISKETYKKFTDPKYAYSPLYMSLEDLETALPAAAVYSSSGLRQVVTPKQIKGHEHAVKFFQNVLTHQARTGAIGLHNNARINAVEDLVKLGLAKQLPGNATPSAKVTNIVAALEDGKRRYYQIQDPVLLEAFEINRKLPLPDIVTDVTKTISKFKLMRPEYWYNQLVREPFLATLTGRAGLITPLHSGKEFASLVLSRITGADTQAMKHYEELRKRGVTGSHNYLEDVIKEKAKLTTNEGARKLLNQSKDLFLSVHEYADAATKVAVYKKLVERAKSGKLTGKPLTEAQAHDAAATYVEDMLNFANRGKNAGADYVRQTSPFFTSWVQGMDALVRHASGYGMNPYEAQQARQMFWTHAMALSAFSLGAAMVLCETSEDFRNASPEEWADNWLMPMPEEMQDKEGRMFKAKGPFEVNTLFRLLPTMAARAWYGDLDKNKDYKKIFIDQTWKDLAPPGLDRLFLLPYAPMPLLEAMYGATFNPLHKSYPIGKEGVVPALRGKGESPIADALAFGSVSPAAVKYIGQGYFGGVYDILDLAAKGVASTFGSKNAKAELQDITKKWPFISAVVTDPDKMDISTGYDFAAKQIEARNSAMMMRKHGIKDAELEKELKEEGRYAKPAERIKSNIAKINTAIDRLKNSTDYKDIADIQRKVDALNERKRKQLGRLEELRSKAEE